MSEDSSIKIKKLDGSNYRQWKRDIKSVLQIKGLFKYLRDDYIPPPSLTPDQTFHYTNGVQPAIAPVVGEGDAIIAPAQPAITQAMFDAAERAFNKHTTYIEDNDKAIGFIMANCNASIQQVFAENENAHLLWQALEDQFGITGSAGIFNDFQLATSWRFEDKRDPTLSLSDLMVVINRLAIENIHLETNVQAMIVLNAVPWHWDNFASVILATTPASNLTIEYLLPLIQNEWHRCHPESTTAVSQQQNNYRGRGNNRRGGGSNPRSQG
jgi:hypothetical protein